MPAPTKRDKFFTPTLDMLYVASFEGYFIDLNPMWEPTLGWSIEELKARPFLEFVHPEDRASTEAEAARLSEGATTVSFENRYLCKDGSYRWLVWSTSADIDEGCLHAVAHDVTGQREAVAAVRKSEAQLQLIVNTALNAVVTIDGDGLITGWNGQADWTFGWEAKEVLGCELADTMLPPRCRDAHRQGLKHFRPTWRPVVMSGSALAGDRFHTVTP